VFAPPAKDKPPGAAAFRDVASKLRVTNMRVFGVTLDERIAQADRPYVFVKIETNEGITGAPMRLVLPLALVHHLLKTRSR
jgi:hypothetical protein